MAVNISADFKANLAQLPDVAGIESIELKFKDSGDVCGASDPVPSPANSPAALTRDGAR